MNEIEKQSVIQRYTERLAEFGDSPLTLGWTKNKHLLRYHILLSQWVFNQNDTLLDFGCGFGDLYGYIQDLSIPLSYYGYDLNADLVEVGKNKYPGIHLSTIDILSSTQAKSFDYAVSSGVHNLKLTDNWAFIEQTFARFAFICRKGFALNFISNKVDIIDNHLYHADPAKILNLAYRYSKKVILNNNYMPFEFTIIVDMDDSFDAATTVYPEYLKYVNKQ